MSVSQNRDSNLCAWRQSPLSSIKDSFVGSRQHSRTHGNFMRHLYIALLGTAVLGFTAPVSALTASQVVEKEIVVINDDGSETTRRTPADTVVPGERIVYTLNYQNDKSEAANDLVLTMPVPGEVKFIEGSADNRASVVTYSADGGQSFASRQTLTVQTADGEWSPASSGDVTHIRWLIAGPVQAGQTGQLAFKGTLK